MAGHSVRRRLAVLALLASGELVAAGCGGSSGGGSSASPDTTDDRSFDSRSLDQGGSFSFAFNKPGTYS
jgi:hypothetical protein